MNPFYLSNWPEQNSVRVTRCPDCGVLHMRLELLCRQCSEDKRGREIQSTVDHRDVPLSTDVATGSRPESWTGGSYRDRDGSGGLHSGSGEGERGCVTGRILSAPSNVHESESQETYSGVIVGVDQRELAALVLCVQREAFGISDRAQAAQKLVVELMRRWDEFPGPEWRETWWPQ